MSALPVWEGNHMVLVCTVDGNPTPNMAWIAPNGTTLQNRTSDGNFTFPSVSRDDSGQYWCNATNGVDPPKSAMVELHVLCKYSFHVQCFQCLMLF